MSRVQPAGGRQSSEAILHDTIRTTICPQVKAEVASQGLRHQKPARPPTITAQASMKRRVGSLEMTEEGCIDVGECTGRVEGFKGQSKTEGHHREIRQGRSECRCDARAERRQGRHEVG